MKTLVLIISILILFIFLFNISKRMRGGEYHSFSFHNKMMTPSISQLELTPKTGIVKIEGSVDKLIQRSLNRLQQKASIRWNDEVAYINVMNEAHLLSDAHLDLITLIVSGLNINYAFACCEWHGDIYRPEYNELVTMYSNKELRIERADTFLWLYPPFTSFLSYEFRDDAEEIDETIEILDEDLDKIVTLVDGKSQDEYLSVLRNKYTIDDMNDILYSLPDKYYSKRLLDIVNAIAIAPDSSLAVHVDALKAIYHSLHSLKTIERKPRIEVYIEYAYNKQSAIDLYSAIHRHTLEVITHILNMPKESKHSYIFCFRFLYPNLCDTYKTVESIDIKNYKIFIFDNSNFNIVEIPKTKDSFSYDEQLFINYEGNNYSIQIEHSEDGSSHKSNFVEFLGRVMISFATVNDFRTVFRSTSYLEEKQKKLKYHLKKESININDSVIYKSFGKKAQMLFEHA